MNPRLHRLWKVYYKPTYRIVAFCLCTILMVLCFPRGNNYNYEYEIKRPWRHENITAPYDFPILKTDAELQAEKDSLMKDFLPYYVRDTIDEIANMRAVRGVITQFGKKIQSYTPHDVSTDTLSALLITSLSRQINKVLQRGIIDVASAINMPDISEGRLILVNANLAEQYNFADLLTPREAYVEVVRLTALDLREYYGQDSRWTHKLLEKIPFSSLLIPNIHYDNTKTDLATKERLENISIFSGKILAGQTIINTGDIVDAHTAQLLNSLKYFSENQTNFGDLKWSIFLGELVVVGGLMLTLFLFLYYFRRDYYRQLHFINLILLLITFLVCVTGLLSSHSANISFIVPYAVLPIMLRIFTDSRLAIYVNIITIFIISFFAYNSHLFIFLHVPAGVIACIALFHLNKRIQIFRSSLYIFAYYMVMYHGYQLWQHGEIVFDVWTITMFAISGVLMLLTYPLIYIIEKLFGFISDVTLLELADTNNKLLRELSEKAPGTFQHSLQVANLGQELAYKLGANSMLVRVGALYHDIGKIVNPNFFTENQVQGVNPHKNLSYEQSARIIISHVSEGVKLAKKHRLPRQIQEIILSHHGNTMARYFYISWCNEHPSEDPDLSVFTYPGKKPKTKEQVIIMMSDAVEAGSKSLTEINDETIDNIVETIIDQQFNARQYDESNVTFADIYEAKKTLKKKLRNIYHARIKYPELIEPRETDESQQEK